jgi:hypothetical protein
LFLAQGFPVSAPNISFKADGFAAA